MVPGIKVVVVMHPTESIRTLATLMEVECRGKVWKLHSIFLSFDGDRVLPPEQEIIMASMPVSLHEGVASIFIIDEMSGQAIHLIPQMMHL